ncbi:MAG: hypothetical protein WCI18_10840 [Pseudomonadota bacterium]
MKLRSIRAIDSSFIVKLKSRYSRSVKLGLTSVFSLAALAVIGCGSDSHKKAGDQKPTPVAVPIPSLNSTPKPTSSLSTEQQTVLNGLKAEEIRIGKIRKIIETEYIKEDEKVFLEIHGPNWSEDKYNILHKYTIDSTQTVKNLHERVAAAISECEKAVKQRSCDSGKVLDEAKNYEFVWKIPQKFLDIASGSVTLKVKKSRCDNVEVEDMCEIYKPREIDYNSKDIRYELWVPRSSKIMVLDENCDSKNRIYYDLDCEWDTFDPRWALVEDLTKRDKLPHRN